MFIAWANEDTTPAPASLRWCMSAGAPLHEDVRLRAEKRLGAPVRQAYGLTEANLAAINAPPDDAIAGSSGKPVAGVELRIIRESGAGAPQGSTGEVLVRGPNVMAGYLDDKMATEHVMRGGWLHTGDVGFVDAEGRLTIVDRSKDLILRGGASIYPSEVESVLSDHPAVRDAAVVGQPDERRVVRGARRLGESAPRRLQGPSTVRVGRCVSPKPQRQDAQAAPSRSTRARRDLDGIARRGPAGSGARTRRS
jgi:acyl-CoA synthetase (AMP-forming)/AMP-acid ligase II